MAIAKKNDNNKNARTAVAVRKKTAAIKAAPEENIKKRPAKAKQGSRDKFVAKMTASRDKTSGDKTSNDKIEPGTVIGVNRGIYKHYAIYAGRNMVIHYASATGDFGGEMCVRKTSVKNFLNSAADFFICEFPDSHGRPRETKRSANIFSTLASTFTGGGVFGTDGNPLAALADIYEFFKKMNYKIYPPAETLRRAKERLGESSYSLFFNNCEHFVVWCKTGVSESHQVNEIIRAITGGR